MTPNYYDERPFTKDEQEWFDGTFVGQAEEIGRCVAALRVEVSKHYGRLPLLVVDWLARHAKHPLH